MRGDKGASYEQSLDERLAHFVAMHDWQEWRLRYGHGGRSELGDPYATDHE
jgi:hypothetical protein